MEHRHRSFSRRECTAREDRASTLRPRETPSPDVRRGDLHVLQLLVWERHVVSLQLRVRSFVANVKKAVANGGGQVE